MVENYAALIHHPSDQRIVKRGIVMARDGAITNQCQAQQ